MYARSRATASCVAVLMTPPPWSAATRGAMHRATCRSFRRAGFLRAVARQQRHLLAALEQARQRLQPLDLLLELRDVLEAAIHGRETHVRYDVEAAQLFHHEISDQP